MSALVSDHLQPDKRKLPTYCITAVPDAIELWASRDAPGPMISSYSGTVLQPWVVWHQARGLHPWQRPARRHRSGIAGRLRARVIERDGYACGLCGGEVEPTDVHIDHVLPVLRGGQDTLDNLQVAHSFCNLSKGARVPEAAR